MEMDCYDYLRARRALFGYPLRPSEDERWSAPALQEDAKPAGLTGPWLVQRLARRGGFTLIEMVIVLAVLAVLGAIGALLVRAPEARLFAQDLQALVQQGRYEAVRRHSPVAVLWSESAREFSTNVIDSSMEVGGLCTSSSVARLASRRLDEYRRVTLDMNDLADGLVWLPSGLPVACDNSDLSDYIQVAVAGGARPVTLSVSPAGRVALR